MRLIIPYIAVLIAVTVCVSAQAQSNYYIEEPKVFTGGVVLGANFAQVDGDTYYGYHKPGLNAGGVVYVHVTNMLGASMELLYAQKGSVGDAVLLSSGPVPVPIAVSRCHINLNYIEVPVTAHLVYRTIDVEAGVSYSRLLKTREWILADPPVTIDVVNNRFNNTDLNYILGIGRKVYKHLYANVRFQYSIIPIRPFSRIPTGYGYAGEGQYNNLLAMRLMYIL